MPDRLKLTKNAQFYRVPQPVDDELIKIILDSACENAIVGIPFILDKFRERRVLQKNSSNFIYSVRVFASNRPVHFFANELEDTIHAFVLIIEIEGYLAVIRKSCANFSEILDENFLLVGSKEFSSTFSDEDVEFQKLALRNMTVSDRAMRVRSYEAANLKGLLSTHSAGRSIPFFFKLRQGNKTKSISGNGRVVESSNRESIDNISLWVREQIKLIELPANSNFLDSFAGSIELNDVLKVSTPNAILIESTSLFERLRKEDLMLLYKNRADRNIKVSGRVIKILESALERVYEIEEDYSISGTNDGARLRINKKSLTPHSKIISKFRVIENGKEVTLQKYIIKNGFYSITFTNPRYMYFMGSCFEDSSGVSEIDNILEILQPIKQLSIVTSEKGKFTKSSKAFSDDSMFGVIETIHNQDDYIFCDDLGNEWADHITFNKNNSNISFIHSKHGEPSTSASNLHDVVGQGIKNLGNMYFDSKLMLSKQKDTFSKKYVSGKGVNTNIKRTRKGDVNKFEGYLGNFLKDYKLNRSCILSCSFISKSEIAKEFNRIKLGKPVRGNVTQLLWIISSFAHAVRDMNARPVIYCRD